MKHGICSERSEFYRVRFAALLLLAALLFAGCGQEVAGGGGEAESPEETISEPSEEETQQALTPAGATVGPDENANMLPAGGKAKDSSQPPPRNPPEGVRTYPATSNRSDAEAPVAYEQDPPTNGDHTPYWQNCGFYSSPIENEAAVHSMDHGAVWISYRPDLPEDQVDVLRDLARQEDYVLVSPYPDLYAPVVATAWRNQLELTGADDPRLQQFVDQFRLSEIAPLSGNGCTDGRGEPEV